MSKSPYVEPTRANVYRTPVKSTSTPAKLDSTSYTLTSPLSSNSFIINNTVINMPSTYLSSDFPGLVCTALDLDADHLIGFQHNTCGYIPLSVAMKHLDKLPHRGLTAVMAPEASPAAVASVGSPRVFHGTAPCMSPHKPNNTSSFGPASPMRQVDMTTGTPVRTALASPVKSPYAPRAPAAQAWTNDDAEDDFDAVAMMDDLEPEDEETFAPASKAKPARPLTAVPGDRLQWTELQGHVAVSPRPQDTFFVSRSPFPASKAQPKPSPARPASPAPTDAFVVFSMTIRAVAACREACAPQGCSRCRTPRPAALVPLADSPAKLARLLERAFPCLLCSGRRTEDLVCVVADGDAAVRTDLSGAIALGEDTLISGWAVPGEVSEDEIEVDENSRVMAADDDVYGYGDGYDEDEDEEYHFHSDEDESESDEDADYVDESYTLLQDDDDEYAYERDAEDEDEDEDDEDRKVCVDMYGDRIEDATHNVLPLVTADEVREALAENAQGISVFLVIPDHAPGDEPSRLRSAFRYSTYAKLVPRSERGAGADRSHHVPTVECQGHALDCAIIAAFYGLSRLEHLDSLAFFTTEDHVAGEVPDLALCPLDTPAIVIMEAGRTCQIIMADDIFDDAVYDSMHVSAATERAHRLIEMSLCEHVVQRLRQQRHQLEDTMQSIYAQDAYAEDEDEDDELSVVGRGLEADHPYLRDDHEAGDEDDDGAGMARERVAAERSREGIEDVEEEEEDAHGDAPVRTPHDMDSVGCYDDADEEYHDAFVEDLESCAKDHDQVTAEFMAEMNRAVGASPEDMEKLLESFRRQLERSEAEADADAEAEAEAEAERTQARQQKGVVWGSDLKPIIYPDHKPAREVVQPRRAFVEPAAAAAEVEVEEATQEAYLEANADAEERLRLARAYVSARYDATPANVRQEHSILLSAESNATVESFLRNSPESQAALEAVPGLQALIRDIANVGVVFVTPDCAEVERVYEEAREAVDSPVDDDDEEQEEQEEDEEEDVEPEEKADASEDEDEDAEPSMSRDVYFDDDGAMHALGVTVRPDGTTSFTMSKRDEAFLALYRETCEVTQSKLLEVVDSLQVLHKMFATLQEVPGNWEDAAKSLDPTVSADEDMEALNRVMEGEIEDPMVLARAFRALNTLTDEMRREIDFLNSTRDKAAEGYAKWEEDRDQRLKFAMELWNAMQNPGDGETSEDEDEAKTDSKAENEDEDEDKSSADEQSPESSEEASSADVMQFLVNLCDTVLTSVVEEGLLDAAVRTRALELLGQGDEAVIAALLKFIKATDADDTEAYMHSLAELFYDLSVATGVSTNVSTDISSTARSGEPDPEHYDVNDSPEPSTKSDMNSDSVVAMMVNHSDRIRDDEAHQLYDIYTDMCELEGKQPMSEDEWENLRGY